MKKKSPLRELKLEKKVISALDSENISGGNLGVATRKSVDVDCPWSQYPEVSGFCPYSEWCPQQ